ncbi:hypothetical protein C0J52_20306 [Blattella germanica]|nr:hypothetical protein C0J52_20306 [Blattella germanica]
MSYLCSYLFVAFIFGVGQCLESNYRTSLRNEYYPRSEVNFETAEIWEDAEIHGIGEKEFKGIKENGVEHSRIKLSADGLVMEDAVRMVVKRGQLQRWQKNIILNAATTCTETANKQFRGKRSPQRGKIRREPDAEMLPSLRCSKVGVTFMNCIAKALEDGCPSNLRIHTKECQSTEVDDLMSNGVAGTGQVEYEKSPIRFN